MESYPINFTRDDAFEQIALAAERMSPMMRGNCHIILAGSNVSDALKLVSSMGHHAWSPKDRTICGFPYQVDPDAGRSELRVE